VYFFAGPFPQLDFGTDRSPVIRSDARSAPISTLSGCHSLDV
jgi:hypothetical protein